MPIKRGNKNISNIYLGDKPIGQSLKDGYNYLGKSAVTYKIFRLYIPQEGIPESDVGNVGINEFILADEIGGSTIIPSSSGVASASDREQDAERALDDSYNDGSRSWVATTYNNSDAWIQFNFDTPPTIVEYGIIGGSYANPTIWELQGSDDGQSWDVIDRQETNFGQSIGDTIRIQL